MCEKSWVEVQADSSSFECKGCAKMTGLKVEMEQLRQLVVALVGMEEVGCANGSGGRTVDYKVGEGDERDARDSSPQIGRRLVRWQEGMRLNVRRQDGKRLDVRSGKIRRRGWRLWERRRREERRGERKRWEGRLRERTHQERNAARRREGNVTFWRARGRWSKCCQVKRLRDRMRRKGSDAWATLR